METFRPRLKNPSKRPTRFVRLKGLRCFPEVHQKILQGFGPREIATYIQQEAVEYTDITRDALEKLVAEYRDSLPKSELASVRIPEVIQQAAKQIESGLDELDELAKLYRIQKGRIEIDVATEKKIGKLFKTTGPEVYIAMRILKNMAELKMDLGIDQRHLGKLEMESHSTAITADITAKYGSEPVAKALQDPNSRRRVLNLATRMLAISKQAAQDIEDDVAEGEIVEAVPALKGDGDGDDE